VALDQRAAGEQNVGSHRLACHLVAGDHEADLTHRLARLRPGRVQLVGDPGQQLLDRVLPARQHHVRMAPLRDRLAALADDRQLVALDDRHPLVGVGERSGGEQARHAGPDHHGVFADALRSRRSVPCSAHLASPHGRRDETAVRVDREHR